MTVHQIHEASIRLTSATHGTFHLPTGMYQRMVEAYFGNVNQNRRVMAAVVSDATSANYFDADEMTLLAVLVVIEVTPEGLTEALGCTSDEFVADAWARFAE